MSGLVFLFKDTGKPESRRLWYALGVRITFATLLVLAIGYGFYTGELRMGLNAPWHGATSWSPVCRGTNLKPNPQKRGLRHILYLTPRAPNPV